MTIGNRHDLERRPQYRGRLLHLLTRPFEQWMRPRSENADPFGVRQRLPEELEPLHVEVHALIRESGEVATRPRQRRREAPADRVAHRDEHRRNLRGHALERDGERAARHHHVRLQGQEFERRRILPFARRPGPAGEISILDDDVLSVDVAVRS